VTAARIALTRAAPPVGAARVDGAACRTKQAMLVEWARALDFPDYFGHNWDALSDVIGDLIDDGPIVIAVDDAVELLADEPPEQLRTLLEVLDDERLTLLLRCPEQDEPALQQRLDQASGR
jgi:RNAse (barnase) inhibitor barstar